MKCAVGVGRENVYARKEGIGLLFKATITRVFLRYTHLSARTRNAGQGCSVRMCFASVENVSGL
jgi:hypothetical protein